MFKFKLGEVVKDVVSGYEGVIMARVEFLTGCIQYGVAPRKLDKDNKIQDWAYIDEVRLVCVNKTGIEKKPSMGGPAQTPRGR